jgi:beta-lactamase class A
MGLTRFRHAKRIALEDLLYLATSMSDNVAGDVLFDLVPSAEVTDAFARLELTGITVWHRMQPARRGGHPVPQLDTLARTLAPRLAFVVLLAELGQICAGQWRVGR